jgi:hypothetical protein
MPDEVTLRSTPFDLDPRNSPGASQALTCLITGGGDTRLRLDQITKRNSYGSPPWPRPQELSFSSSTASTISERAYAAAKAAYLDFEGRLNSGGVVRVFEHHVEQIRQNIKSLFELDLDTGVVLSPSGTDSTLHALFLSRCVLKGPLISIIAAADETGRGVSLAAAGRHFDVITSGGRRVVKGEPIVGLATEVESVTIAARDRVGNARPIAEVDEDVRRRVAEAIHSGLKVILHVMDHSKTGLRHPSDDCIRAILADHQASVQIVVDACQARLSRTRCMVILTGSKFFSGPAFSGVLLVPAQASISTTRLSDSATRGLADYSSQYDWPMKWTPIRSSLDSWLNMGQLLRWIAAIEEIRAYYAVPKLFRKLALQEFASATRRIVNQHSSLQLLSVTSAQNEQLEDYNEFSAQTIFPFLVKCGNRVLSIDECRTLYRELNEDVSEFFQPPSNFQSELAAKLCHIGQPIAIADGSGDVVGALRLSADARLVSHCWFGKGNSLATNELQKVFGQVGTILNKLTLLVEHLDRM